MLQFDQPLDLGRGKIGRLVGGRLKGQVTIRSDWKEPGPEDDLLIDTRDIQLTEQTISTPNPVDFRWGPHFGRGQDMVIKLLAGQPRPGRKDRPEHRRHRVVRARATSSGCTSTWARRWQSSPRGRPTPAAVPPGSVPVEINCRGPFRFDVVDRVATFRDRVDVMKAQSVPARPIRSPASCSRSTSPTRPKEKPGRAGAAKTGRARTSPARSTWWRSGSRPAAIRSS